MKDDKRWLQDPLEKWQLIALPHHVLKDNFVSGDQSSDRLSVRYFRNEPDGSLRAKVLLGRKVQGPPGHVHGGCMAALLDEAMGGAAWMKSHTVVAAELTTRFKTMLPLNTRGIIEASVVSVDGRKVRTQGVLRDEANTIYCEGEALFIVLDPERFGVLTAGLPSLTGEG